MNLAKPVDASPAIDVLSLSSGRKGITPAVGRALGEAASVCLDDRGHSSPAQLPVSGTHELNAKINWLQPDDQTKRCWNDDGYTTEQGAYCIAALVVEQCGLEVIERSRKGTGFDFWLGEPSQAGSLFQGLSRLEVSGIRSGDDAVVNTRLKQKLKQTEVSDGGLPAVAVIVEFGAPSVKMVER